MIVPGDQAGERLIESPVSRMLILSQSMTKGTKDLISHSFNPTIV